MWNHLICVDDLKRGLDKNESCNQLCGNYRVIHYASSNTDCKILLDRSRQQFYAHMADAIRTQLHVTLDALHVTIPARHEICDSLPKDPEQVPDHPAIQESS